MLMDPYIDIFSTLYKAYASGRKGVRQLLVISFGFLVLAVLLGIASETIFRKNDFIKTLIWSFGFMGSTLILMLYAQQKERLKALRFQRIEEIEKRLVENPKETKVAWELAQIKLENYLNRNLSQVKSIFWLTLFVMAIGFTLIGYGAVKSFGSPESLKPSIVSVTSGLLISFIGATFLTVYKSTMAQAKEYVTILERINAVGMAVQILDSIDDECGAMRNEAMVKLSQDLLAIYKNSNSPSSTSTKFRITR